MSDGNYLARSTNGVDWSGGIVFPEIRRGGRVFWGAAYGKGTYVLAGQACVMASCWATAFFSNDGEHWEAASLVGTGGSTACAFGNNVFVLVGFGEEIFTSDDGRRWSKVYSGDVYSNFIDVCFADGIGFVAVSEKTIARSSDGQTWTTEPNPNLLYNIIFGANTFCAAGGAGIFLSADGVHWSKKRNEGGSGLNDIGYGNGQFVIMDFKQPVTITVAARAPARLTISNGPNGVAVNASEGSQEMTYYLQATSDLSDPKWEFVASLTLPLPEPVLLEGSSPRQRFFRLR
ncbi:MAG: hypothetical protein HYY24_18500 [Verrucomicrobia bacterium]|nr:hypothetical protein [Verrucomicrobiota bacterium]